MKKLNDKIWTPSERGRAKAEAGLLPTVDLATSAIARVTLQGFVHVSQGQTEKRSAHRSAIGATARATPRRSATQQILGSKATAKAKTQVQEDGSRRMEKEDGSKRVQKLVAKAGKRAVEKAKVYGWWTTSWANGVSNSHNSSHRKGGSHKMHGESMRSGGNRASDR